MTSQALPIPAVRGLLTRGANLLSVLKVAACLFIELTKRLALQPAVQNTSRALRRPPACVTPGTRLLCTWFPFSVQMPGEERCVAELLLCAKAPGLLRGVLESPPPWEVGDVSWCCFEMGSAGRGTHDSQGTEVRLKCSSASMHRFCSFFCSCG